MTSSLPVDVMLREPPGLDHRRAGELWQFDETNAVPRGLQQQVDRVGREAGLADDARAVTALVRQHHALGQADPNRAGAA